MAADEQANIERNMGLSQETECKTIADGEPVPSNPVALRRSSSEVFAIKESSEVTVSIVTQNTIFNKLETTGKPKSMRRSMSERNLSNVKEMISAFETGLTQDKKIRAAKTRTGSSTDEVNKNQTQDKKIWVTKIQTCRRQDEVNENKVQSRQENSANLKKSEKNTQKSMCTENTQDCNSLSRCPRDEKTMVSVDKNLEEQSRSGLLSKQRRKRSSVAEGGREKQSKFMHTEDSQHCNVRGSRLWIFPPGAMDSCTTASGTNVFRKNTDSCVRENTSENHFQRGFNGGSGAKTNDKWKNIQRSKKLKSETCEDSESSRGPVGQVVRAVIMVGFASLVLFTRQKTK